MRMPTYPVYQERIMLKLLQTPGAVVIRDVDAGEDAFLYSSGNYGPGYVTVKGMVGHKSVMVPLCYQLAIKLAEMAPDLDFIAGNVSGGVVPGWILSEAFERILGKSVPLG